jgi:hypothetical protein
MDENCALIRRAIQSNDSLAVFGFYVYIRYEYQKHKDQVVYLGHQGWPRDREIELARLRNRQRAEAVKEKLDAILRHELRNRIVITEAATGETYNANNIPKT